MRMHMVICSVVLLGAFSVSGYSSGSPMSPTIDEIRITKTGAEYKRVSNDELRRNGVINVEACSGRNGEDGAWMEYRDSNGQLISKYTGKIWCGVVIPAVSPPWGITQLKAEEYCIKIGAALPSGYPDSQNGRNGFPEEDSDLQRLTKSMGAQDYKGDGYSRYIKGSETKAILPNHLEKPYGDWRSYWSSSVPASSPTHAYYLNDKWGAFDSNVRNYPGYGDSARCVVARH